MTTSVTILDRVRAELREVMSDGERKGAAASVSAAKGLLDMQAIIAEHERVTPPASIQRLLGDENATNLPTIE